MPFAVQSIEVIVGAEDDGKSNSTTALSFDADTVANQNYAALVAFADAYAAGVDGVSSARIDSYSIVIRAFDAAAAAADPASNVERKAKLIAEANDGATSTFLVPSVIDALVNVDDGIPLTGPVLALANLITEGDGTIAPSTHYGRPFVRIKDAYQYHQKSHIKRRQRRG